MQRIYRVTLDNETHLGDFFNREEVEYVEIVEEEMIELYIPNDYEYIDRESPNTALELIKAPLAWNITQGNPNILAGVLDTSFNLNHEDTANQIVLDLGTTNTPSDGIYHGTIVSSALAAHSDNNLGIASIGYNSKLAIKTGGGHNGALLLSQQPGVKVINISLLLSCNFSPVAA